jgi:hypothetical protein
MRPLLALALLCAGAACSKPQTFEARYRNTAEQLENKAAAIDAQLANEAAADENRQSANAAR